MLIMHDNVVNVVGSGQACLQCTYERTDTASGIAFACEVTKISGLQFGDKVSLSHLTKKLPHPRDKIPHNPVSGCNNGQCVMQTRV
jgi:hypothetical protein